MMGGGGCRILLYGRKEGRGLFFSPACKRETSKDARRRAKENDVPLSVTYAHQTPGEKRKLLIDLLLVFCLISPPLDRLLLRSLYHVR